MNRVREMKKTYEEAGNSLEENWAISRECYLFINKILESGKTILEFGSGIGTEILNQNHNMISIEEDSSFIGRHPSLYIYAPLKKLDDKLLEKYSPSSSWYDPEIIDKELNGKQPKKYDLILVDGPAYGGGRGGFYEYLHLFDTSLPIVFDDIEREDDKRIFDMVVEKLGRPIKVVEGRTNTKTGIILTKELEHLKD
tara:strand:- start:3113 stop:3703 length:591 start_codon:yes stop_codon:yes gene_type:complete